MFLPAHVVWQVKISRAHKLEYKVTFFYMLLQNALFSDFELHGMYFPAEFVYMPIPLKLSPLSLQVTDTTCTGRNCAVRGVKIAAQKLTVSINTVLR